jgi:hypothetical protein
LEHWLSTIHCTTICECLIIIYMHKNNIYKNISLLLFKKTGFQYICSIEIQSTPKMMFTGDGGQNHNVVWFLLLRITTKFCVHAFNLIRYTWYLLFALRTHSIFNDNIFVMCLYKNRILSFKFSSRIQVAQMVSLTLCHMQIISIKLSLCLKSCGRNLHFLRETRETFLLK